MLLTDCRSPQKTVWRRFSKYDLIRFTADGPKLNCVSSFVHSLLWGMVSKALEKSSSNSTADPLLSVVRAKSSNTREVAVCMLWPFRKPAWCSVSRLFSVIKDDICCSRSFSNTFESAHKMLMGRRFVKALRWGFFLSGMILACFQQVGKIEVAMMLLNR